MQVLCIISIADLMLLQLLLLACNNVSSIVASSSNYNNNNSNNDVQHNNNVAAAANTDDLLISNAIMRNNVVSSDYNDASNASSSSSNNNNNNNNILSNNVDLQSNNNTYNNNNKWSNSNNAKRNSNNIDISSLANNVVDRSNEWSNDSNSNSNNDGTSIIGNTLKSSSSSSTQNGNHRQRSGAAKRSVSLPTASVMQSSNAARKLRRGKRYLQFAKGSRMSWRTTVKNNILAVNTLWGYGFGFRANFPFPGPEESRRPFFKRDVLHAITDVLDGHGLDGRACMLKSYCTAALDAHTNIGGGMLFKMLKIIFSIGLDGQACILKAFCVAHAEEEELERRQQGQPGVLLNLLKYIFTLDTHDKRHFPFLRLENCHQLLHSHCPLSFNSISPYTDDV